MPKLLQFTDLHLYADAKQTCHGVVTRESFQQIFEQAVAEHPNADRLIFTGDVADDCLPETYDFLPEFLGNWFSRCRFLPGNHDDRQSIRRLNELATREAKNCRLPATDEVGDSAIFVEDLAGWQLIGLDTQIVQAVPGELGQPQRNWLQQRLREFSEPALVFLHHPPAEIDCSWLDAIGLNDRDELAACLADAPQVHGLFAGHVHQEYSGPLGSAMFFTTPATCMQFSRQPAEHHFVKQPPGYRVIECSGNTMTTFVIRIPELTATVFPPNHNSEAE